jgi:hypothetical protein
MPSAQIAKNPTNGTLAADVRRRSARRDSKRERLSCRDRADFFPCRACGVLLDRIRLAILGSPGVWRVVMNNQLLEELFLLQDQFLPALMRSPKVQFLSEAFQFLFRLDHAIGLVNLLEVGNHRRAVHRRDVPQRGPHQVHNAQLHNRFA